MHNKLELPGKSSLEDMPNSLGPSGFENQMGPDAPLTYSWQYVRGVHLTPGDVTESLLLHIGAPTQQSSWENQQKGLSWKHKLTPFLLLVNSIFSKQFLFLTHLKFPIKERWIDWEVFSFYLMKRGVKI